MIKYLRIKQNFDFFVGKPKSCKEIKDSDPSAATGTYEVEVDGHRIQLVCDMDISGGGWAVSPFLFICFSITINKKQNLFNAY